MTTSRPSVRLRPANLEDLEMVFRWRNLPFLVSKGSFQSRVTHEEHAKWFTHAIDDPEKILCIIEVDGIPAGQIRFERREPARCVVSVYLLEEFTGGGLGTDAMEQGVRRVLEQWPVLEIVAYVREDNTAAARAFARYGFDERFRQVDCPEGHRVFVLSRGNQGL